MPGVHAKLSPSAAKRWMECPGSVAAGLDTPDHSSPYAAEGTIAHELADRALAHGEDISRFMGEDLECDGHQITVTDDMLNYIQVYLDYVKDRARVADVICYESRVYVNAVSEDLHGTADCYLIDGNTIEVIDLKFGKGQRVYAEENPQLMIYALGVLEEVENNPPPRKGPPLDFISLTIVQPRADEDNPVDTWTIETQDLLTWRDEVLKPAAEKALRLDAKRVPGDWCRSAWCPARGTCPALGKKAMEIAQMEFADDGTARLPAPDDMTLDTLVQVLTHRDLLKSWLTEVEGHALSLLQAGHDIPGFKLVEGRSTRKWIDPKAAEAELRKKFKVSEITEQKLKSFTQIEKLSTKAKELVADLVTKPEGAPTIAPITDKRPALVAACVNEFDAIEDQTSAGIDDLL